MNRPDKKNALTLAMYKAMTAAFEGSKADGSVRCVLIAGVPVHQINARGTFMVSKYAIAHLERAQNERSASTNFRTGRVISPNPLRLALHSRGVDLPPHRCGSGRRW